MFIWYVRFVALTDMLVGDKVQIIQTVVGIIAAMIVVILITGFAIYKLKHATSKR